jgi:HPt (histidine-containing phosphotransfer) domain-containing protein
MDDYLTKPFSLEQLRNCIDRWRDPETARTEIGDMAAPMEFAIEQSLAQQVVEIPATDTGVVELTDEIDEVAAELVIDEQESEVEPVNMPEELQVTEPSSVGESPEPEIAAELEPPVIQPEPEVSQKVAPAPKPATPVAKAPKPREAEVVRYETLESIIALDPASGEGLLARLIGMYESNSVELLKDIQTCYAAQDAEGVRKGAHALKSSSGNVGAERLAVICKEIEFSARKNTLEAVEGHVAMLANEHSLVLKKLYEYQPGEPA